MYECKQFFSGHPELKDDLARMQVAIDARFQAA